MRAAPLMHENSTLACIIALGQLITIYYIYIYIYFILFYFGFIACLINTQLIDNLIENREKDSI
jgi:hypothetical protein